MGSKQRYSMVVHGRVQGVGFRYYCVEQGESLGLTGWVRNRVDGSVELEAQGTEDQLEAFRSAVQKGPSLSRVDSIDERARECEEGEIEFKVRF